MGDAFPTQIVDVWDHNLQDTIDQMSTVIEKYNHVAIATEFPGKVYQDMRESEYRQMKANVDRLKIIQIGITLFDEHCNLPVIDDVQLVWQFNFREFNETTDAHAVDVITSLKTSGFDFVKNLSEGIPAVRFGEVLMSSGLLMNEDVRWVTIHGGYDCGYLVRLLKNQKLPETEEAFYALLKTYLKVVYDIKHISQFYDLKQGGLEKMCNDLLVQRTVETCHQGGSDSLLTYKLYKQLHESYFGGSPGRLYANAGRLVMY